MDPLDLEFSRLGVALPLPRRSVCATAPDGTLVLVCKSSGFSRPSEGVLRFSAILSTMVAPNDRIDLLRNGLESASKLSTPVRVIIQTPATDKGTKRLHARADLVGSVSAFDGDAYSVDFVRAVAPEAKATEQRVRRKR
ncbi:MAG: hypothetical protein ABW136_10245 [Steroidobacteraceae bacterium]